MLKGELSHSSPPSAVHSHNLLIFSDVHLGSDLIQFAQPDAPLYPEHSLRRDRELANLLRWYATHRRGGKCWRLVIAGDFVDFAGMSIEADENELRLSLSKEEVQNGLGSAEEHTLIKLRCVVEHHADVFRALAEFLAAGNSLVVVRGNHDVDFHWESVKDEFRSQLHQFADFSRDKIEFRPWFYYEKDRVYIEHGHQYDGWCSVDHVLNPVSPLDPRRSSRSVADIMLRYVVRPLGMSESGHDGAGPLHYIRFAKRLGLSGAWKLIVRFMLAVHRLLTVWRAHFSDATAKIRLEQERRMSLLGRRRRLGINRLRRLERLQVPPATRSVSHILSCFFLERVVLGALGALLLLTFFVVFDQWHYQLIAGGGLCVVLVALAAAWNSSRVAIDPSDQLRRQTRAIGSLFPAAFVVMGHTHLPELSDHDGITYVNLGAWAEEETVPDKIQQFPATRTHFVLENVDGEPSGELLVWGAAGQPEPFGARVDQESKDDFEASGGPAGLEVQA